MNPDDDEPGGGALAAALTALWAATDPLPAAAYRSAIEAYAWRDLDRDLARLSAEHDGDTRLAHARGGTSHTLTFESGPYVIDLQAGRDGRRRQLLGQFDPATAADVTIESADGAWTVRADERGRFIFTDLAAPAWIRLAVTVGNDAFVTEWFYV